MDNLRQEEFAALRATIRERGTVRAITFLVTLIAWAALLLYFEVSGPRNILGTLLSLLVLAGGFEAVFQIHLGVERVGRYLQVEYEEAAADKGAGGPRWETTAMAYGSNYPGVGSDALFSGVFVLAAVVNLLPVLQAVQVPVAFACLMAAHLAFLVRVRIAKHVAGLQRAQDLERFRQLKMASAGTDGSGNGPRVRARESPTVEPQAGTEL
jgi:hypothetical protein